MSTAPLVLTVDDELGILRLIQMELAAQGFQVISAQSGEAALQLLEEHQPDIALVDLMMPEMSGMELMKRIQRIRPIPVIFVTARDKEQEKVRGLDFGADDYVVKPFSPEELSARIRAVLRRANAGSEPERLVKAGEVEIDLNRRLVKRNGEPLSLTRTEWLLLQQLAFHPGKLMLNSDLLTKVWGPEYRDDLQYLRVWISRLRAKLEVDPSSPKILKTRTGIGYIFLADTPEDEENAFDTDGAGESKPQDLATPA
jgi:two-component system, OmpR family, KDP operon response regulator KdpE